MDLPGDVMAELARRYGEPHRHHHDLAHAREVVAHVVELGGDRACRVAAWFHDAVDVPGSTGNEEASARLLLALLADDPDAAEAARLVRVTASHVAADGDHRAAVLCDADLATLGRDPAGYDAYVAAVRREHADVPEEDWRRGRAAVLRAFLDRDRIFVTEQGHARWEAAARANLTRELATLA